MKREVDRARISVTVEVVEGDPNGILKAIDSGKFPREGLRSFDEVWIVVDHDGTDRKSFLAGCRKVMGRRRGPSVHGVVSVPCFEVWLNAHYGQVRPYATQCDAQQHYRELTGQSGKNSKKIPDSFPWHQRQAAVDQCTLEPGDLPEIDTQGPCPSTTMPYLLESLNLVELPAV